MRALSSPGEPRHGRRDNTANSNFPPHQSTSAEPVKQRFPIGESDPSLGWLFYGSDGDSHNAVPAGYLSDATGRVSNPNTAYIWTVTSTEAAFAAAVSSGFIPDGEIYAFIWMGRIPAIHAMIRNTRTRVFAIYALNPETARPYFVGELFGSPTPLTPPKAAVQDFPLRYRSANIDGEMALFSEDGCYSTSAPEETNALDA
jgi:outer membrane protein assembly factor BamB